MSAPSIQEQQIVEALHRVPTDRWGEVLDFLAELHEQEQLRAEVAARGLSRLSPSGKPWTARELRQLLPAQRDAILEAAAADADPLYRQGLD